MAVPKRKKPRRHGNTEKNLVKNSMEERIRDQVPPTTPTLLDLRGSVPVPGPQDFDAIRQQVIRIRSTGKAPAVQNDNRKCEDTESRRKA
jgi:hypothetical protein